MSEIAKVIELVASSQNGWEDAVRTAVREFAEHEQQRAIEAQEHEILHKHRKRLARQARALITEQARP